MPLSPENEASMRLWITNATYEQLLYRWRHVPCGSVWFQGKMGDFYAEEMERKRLLLTDEERVEASKVVGW